GVVVGLGLGLSRGAEELGLSPGAEELGLSPGDAEPAGPLPLGRPLRSPPPSRPLTATTAASPSTARRIPRGTRNRLPKTPSSTSVTDRGRRCEESGRSSRLASGLSEARPLAIVGGAET